MDPNTNHRLPFGTPALSDEEMTKLLEKVSRDTKDLKKNIQREPKDNQLLFELLLPFELLFIRTLALARQQNALPQPPAATSELFPFLLGQAERDMAQYFLEQAMSVNAMAITYILLWLDGANPGSASSRAQAIEKPLEEWRFNMNHLKEIIGGRDKPYGMKLLERLVNDVDERKKQDQPEDAILSFNVALGRLGISVRDPKEMEEIIRIP
ncbi:hypothetical protein SLS62_000691 [Diatrype stigma]|uniref:Uncharacterized protein n=1 Tax=Diatrype stigma TaxID=117547 RepID=A0AAN9YSB3_9PEZI